MFSSFSCDMRLALYTFVHDIVLFMMIHMVLVNSCRQLCSCHGYDIVYVCDVSYGSKEEHIYYVECETTLLPRSPTGIR